MFLKRITLQNYRSFTQSQFNLAEDTIIVAENTRGKTNLLEAIFCFSTGKPLRGEKEIEVIKEGEFFTNLEVDMEDIEGIKKLRIFWSKEDLGRKKQLQVNGVNRNLNNFIGNLRAVIFTPENFDILNGSPSVRRNYLDSILVQINKEYRMTLTKYKKTILQRNRLLEAIREKKATLNELDYWNENLLQLGRFIQEKRFQFLSFINNKLKEYQSLHREQKKVQNNYLINLVNEERLIKYQQTEIEAGVTLIGPHRDDFEITLAEKKLVNFGSRGEQRLAILSMTLTVLDFIEFFVQERPILLLDDIFSELDEYHRQSILEVFNKQQTIVTTTEWNNKESSKFKIIRIK